MKVLNVSFDDPNEIEIIKKYWLKAWLKDVSDTRIKSERYALDMFEKEWKFLMRKRPYNVYQENHKEYHNDTVHFCCCLSAAMQSRMFSFILEK